MVNIKTKKILTLDVTDEKLHNGRIMKKLVEYVLINQDKKKVKTLLGDGAYDIKRIPDS